MAVAALGGQSFELAQQLFLPLGEIDRRLDDDVAVQIAVVRRAQGLDALAAQAERLAALCFRRDLDVRGAVQRRQVDLPAERGGGEAHRHLAVEVGRVALEYRVGLDGDLHIEVAGRAAVHPGLAFAAQPDAVAFVDAGRDLDVERLVRLETARPLALRARLGNDLAVAVAGRTGLLDGKEALRHPHLALAAAGRTGLGLRAGLGAGAVAHRALLAGRDANLGFGAVGRLLEGDLEVVAQVGAAEYAGASAPSTTGAPENVAEDVAERVGKAAEAGRSPAHGRLRIDAGMAETVVRGTLGRVAQDFVRLLRFLELLLGPFILRIAIRVVLHRELAIGLFDRFFVSVAIDAEHFVVVALCHLRTCCALCRSCRRTGRPHSAKNNTAGWLDCEARRAVPTLWRPSRDTGGRCGAVLRPAAPGFLTSCPSLR